MTDTLPAIPAGAVRAPPAQVYQFKQRQEFYDDLARWLPTEGKDYTVDISFGPDSTLRPTFKALTAFGTQWIQYVEQQLQKKRGSNGSNPASIGPVPAQQSVL